MEVQASGGWHTEQPEVSRLWLRSGEAEHRAGECGQRQRLSHEVGLMSGLLSLKQLMLMSEDGKR